MTEKSKNHHQNQPHPLSIPQIIKEIRLHSEDLRVKKKIKSPQKLLDLFGQITGILNNQSSNDELVNHKKQNSQSTHDQIIKLENEIYDLKITINDNNVEMKELKALNAEFYKKFNELIESSETIEEANKISKEALEIEKRVSKKMVRVRREEEKKKIKIANLEKVDQVFDEIRVDLNSCQCHKCQYIHNKVTYNLDYLQQNFIDLNDSLSNAHANRDRWEVRSKKWLSKLSLIEKLWTNMQNALVKRNPTEEVAALKASYQADCEEFRSQLYQQADLNYTADYIDSMAENFRINIQDLKDRVVVLLKNISFTSRYPEFLQDSWKYLEGILGKSSGEVAQIWALLPRR